VNIKSADALQVKVSYISRRGEEDYGENTAGVGREKGGSMGDDFGTSKGRAITSWGYKRFWESKGVRKEN